MLWAVILFPLIAGAAAIAVPWRPARRWLLLPGSVGHLAAVAGLWVSGPRDGMWIGLDEPGLLFLSITSVLFAAVTVYTIGYLGRESEHVAQDPDEGFFFRNAPDAIFVCCFLLFLAFMSLVCLCRHLGLLWVSVEATTLVSAPLIHYHRHHRSLEATWKYLLICSVGIALALLGNFFLAFAARGLVAHLTMGELIARAQDLNPVWLKAAFILFLVGYGTKMGLVPMHTWLPDAHSEAPSMVSALLSGALLNCAFLGLLRGHAILGAAGLGAFSGGLLVMMGLLSMGLAAVFLVRQGDYKRMLAYSSVEHMGILALGVGLGGLACVGSMLHAMGHSLTKGLLFLTAGNLLAAYGTKNTAEVHGALRTTPVTGVLWLAGLLAITGSPPFGLFVSELVILRGILEAGRWGVAVGYLLALGVAFVAMARIVLPMVFNRAESLSTPEQSPGPSRLEKFWSVAPPVALGIMVLILGLYAPPSLWAFLQSVASRIGIR